MAEPFRQPVSTHGRAPGRHSDGTTPSFRYVKTRARTRTRTRTISDGHTPFRAIQRSGMAEPFRQPARAPGRAHARHPDETTPSFRYAMTGAGTRSRCSAAGVQIQRPFRLTALYAPYPIAPFFSFSMPALPFEFAAASEAEDAAGGVAELARSAPKRGCLGAGSVGIGFATRARCPLLARSEDWNTAAASDSATRSRLRSISGWV